MISKLCFKLLTRNCFSLDREDLPQILPNPIIFPFELSPNVTFPPLSLVMLEDNESSLIMCLEQTLSKTIPYTP
jgi:hypothetical protein